MQYRTIIDPIDLKIQTAEPAHIQIGKHLRHQIENGILQVGQRLPSTKELSEKWNIHDRAIQKAMQQLSAEGIIERSPRRGTFVTSRKQKNVFTKLAGMIMTTSGDLYGNMADAAVQQLQFLGYHPIMIDLPMAVTSPGIFNDRLNELVNSRPVGIIIDGDQRSEEGLGKLVSRLKGQNIGIVFRDRLGIEGDFTRVLTDDVTGRYLGTRHLLELGHRDIMIMAGSTHTDPGMRDGCRKAFAEFGIDWDYGSRLIPKKGESLAETKATIQDRLSSPKRPTAIFASQDSQAVMAYLSAMRIGLRVPEDLSLLGYNNTPWVEKIDVPLSSISLREQLIGRTIVDKMFGADSKKSINSTTIIEPELIIRNSTAPKAIA